MGKVLQLGTTKRPDNRPLIAVSMMVHNVQELDDYFVNPEYQQADVLEWRIDAWQELTTLTREILDKVVRMSKRPIIFTWRTEMEGGLKTYQKDQYTVLYQNAIEAGVAAIDIEVALVNEQHVLITQAQRNAVVVIGSRHDWTYPSNLNLKMHTLNDFPIDVLKYAVMVENQDQAQTLLEAARELSNQTEKPLIAMAMGSVGSYTRLVGFSYGSQLTFAQMNTVSAPGQLSIAEVRQYFERNA